MSEDTRLPLAPPDPATDLVGQLRAAAPQVFSEGRVDFDKLRAALGDQVEAGTERYGLGWAGKAEAFQNVRAPSVGTLLPMPGDSVNWDSTENLIIEGDNLEVLKLLQKPYHGRVKMIYIDPPYNTGNDFIYRDNYRQSLNDYLRFSGQLGEDGSAQSTNRDSSGRYHSDWLSMMYPRLFLARSLLREDGVIFVSIDDNEVHNLRMLMNEVFGEENFIACICWQKKYAPSNDTVDFSPMHDFILVYGRTRSFNQAGKVLPLLNKLERTEEQNKLYKNPDEDPRGLWASDNYICNKTSEQRPNLYYAIIHPKTKKEIWPSKTAVWRYSKERHEKNVAEKRIWWGSNMENPVPRYKRFLDEVGGVVADTWWTHKDVGHNDEAKKLIKQLFPGEEKVFDTPKPVRLIKRMITLATTDDNDNDDEPSIVLDFFAGSGTTGQATLELNEEDRGKRRFILVQLPEPINSRNFKTISSITRERVKRAIKNLKKPGSGFRAFRLSSSNFRIWNAGQTPEEATKLAEQLQLYSDNSGQARGEQDVLWELILKSGLPLSATVTKVKVDGGNAWSVDDNKLLISLDKKLSRETLRAMIALKPQRLLCLDAAFAGNDALKTSIVLEARSHGIAFHTV